MKTILKTTQLEFGKSDFLIDLVKHESGLLYIEIVQSIIGSEQKNNSIKINPSILTDLIKVLEKYQNKIPPRSSPKFKYISDIDQEKIQERYLKGVCLNDLAMQFDQDVELIEMILRNRKIEIVPNGYKPRKNRYWQNWKNKRKR